MNEEPTSAVLILANGQHVVFQYVSQDNLMRFLKLWKHYSRLVAGYILNPSQKTIEESRKL